MIPSSYQITPSREATNPENQATIPTWNQRAMLRLLQPSPVTRVRSTKTESRLAPESISPRLDAIEGGQRRANEMENAGDNTHFESQVSTFSQLVLLSEFSDLNSDIDIIAIKDLEPAVTTVSSETDLMISTGESNVLSKDKGKGKVVDGPGNAPTQQPLAQQRAQLGEPDEEKSRDDEHISSDPNCPEIDKDSTHNGLKHGNWLTHNEMLAESFKRARIQDFRYNRPDDTKSVKEAISRAAAELLSKLERDMAARSSIAPLVFIAIGFGCLIVQELIALIDEGSRILEEIFCIIFFDAPFIPKKHYLKGGGKALNLPPPSTARPIAHLQWSEAIDSWEIWERFHPRIQKKELPTVWFHIAEGPYNPTAPPMQAVGVKFVLLIRNSTFPADPVTFGFLSQLDPNYKSFVSEIKGCLILKASMHEKFNLLLAKFIHSYDLDVKDDKKRCPLHRAAEYSNATALAMLIAKRPDLVSCQDQDGLTPLHSAVKRAVESTGSQDNIRSLQCIIGALLDALDENQLGDTMKDRSGKLPWDYIGKNSPQWIKEMKNDRILSLRNGELTYGAQVAQLERLEDMISQAKVGNSKQMNTCKESNALLTRFYIKEEGDDSKDSLRQLRYDIYKTVYDEKRGSKKMFESQELFKTPFTLEGEIRATCKWIHLPSNNERWVHDLFLLQFRCNDDSTRTHRNRGSARSGRHIDTGVWEYSQTHDLCSKESPHGASSVTAKTVKETGIGKRSVTALFMPVLGFETYGNRQKLRNAMERFSSIVEDSSAPFMANADEHTAEVDIYNENLIQAYFNDKNLPLHCRRTLHQLTYNMLHDTAAHDSSQVMFKWQKEKDEREQGEQEGTEERAQKEKEMLDYPVLMIDQLWLWILEDEQTVITSFPDIWNPSPGDYSLIRHLFADKLKSDNYRQLIDGSMDLVNLIIRGSIDVLKRRGPCAATIYDSFRSKIHSIAAQHDDRFRQFNGWVDALHRNGIDQQEKARLTNILFDHTAKTDHLAEILGVKHELDSVQQVFSKQKSALESFARIAGQQRTVKSDKNPNITHGPRRPPYKPTPFKRSRGQTWFPKYSVTTPPPAHCHDNQDEDTGPNPSEQALENLDLVNSNINRIKELETQAERVRVEIEGLLSRMQKQANAWEARFAREGSEHTQYQSNITLVFTIVTVFFLPLSFLSSVFAIQVDSFPHDEKTGELNWPIRDVMGLLFGISFIVIALLAVLGFRIHSIARFFVENGNPVSRLSSKWVGLWPRNEEKGVNKLETSVHEDKGRVQRAKRDAKFRFLPWNRRETANITDTPWFRPELRTDTVWQRPELNAATLAKITAQNAPTHPRSASSITGSWGSAIAKEEGDRRHDGISLTVCPWFRRRKAKVHDIERLWYDSDFDRRNSDW